MTDDRARIEQLYREYWRCMIEKDVDGLRAMMADDYVLMHMTGTRQSADEFLRGLSRGTFQYFSAEHDTIDVTLRGSAAEMVGNSRVAAVLCELFSFVHSLFFYHTALTLIKARINLNNF